jgi:TldD protein
MNLARHFSALLAAGLLSFATIAPLSTSAQSTRADANTGAPTDRSRTVGWEKDPVLKAMLDELNRSMTHLQLPGFEKPYFIEYRLEEVQDFETRAVFGSTQGSHRNHARIARITVRVGDYKTDNSGPRGDGAIQLASIDDDPIALPSALWAGTDQAYKAALAAFAQKQAELKQVQTPPQADDFSKAKPIVSLADPLTLSIDENA